MKISEYKEVLASIRHLFYVYTSNKKSELTRGYYADNMIIKEKNPRLDTLKKK